MMNAKQLIKDAEQRLMTQAHRELKDASAVELHNAISGAAMDAIAPVWTKKEEERFPRRKAAYLSMPSETAASAASPPVFWTVRLPVMFR